MNYYKSHLHISTLQNSNYHSNFCIGCREKLTSSCSNPLTYSISTDFVWLLITKINSNKKPCYISY